MSRIAVCVLAAAATLIAGPTSADRDCFVGPCRTSSADARPARVAAADVSVTGPRIIRAGYLRAQDRVYVAGQFPLSTRNLRVEVPGTIYPDGNVVGRYPYLQDDPSWRLCQVDQGEGRRWAYECGPYSYHPFGVYGYRPNGTFGPSDSSPNYALAPSAKIIRIDSAN